MQIKVSKRINLAPTSMHQYSPGQATFEELMLEAENTSSYLFEQASMYSLIPFLPLPLFASYIQQLD